MTSRCSSSTRFPFPTGDKPKESLLLRGEERKKESGLEVVTDCAIFWESSKNMNHLDVSLGNSNIISKCDEKEEKEEEDTAFFLSISLK